MKNNTAQKNIPRGWEIKTLSSLALIKKGEQLNKLAMDDSGEYPALNGGISPSGYTDKWNIEANTITISEGGNSCGYINFNTEKFWCGGHCYALINLKENINNNFLYQALKSKQEQLMRLRVGSGLPNIQKRSVDEFPLLIPESKNEQQKIAEILGTVDEDIAKTQEVIKVTEKLKRGLMQQLFTRGIGHTKFKKTKIGDIPEKWSELVFGDVVKKANQGVNTTTEKVQYSVSGISVLRSNNIYENYISYSDVKYVDSETFERLSDNCKPQEGDILYCNIGSAMGSASILERDEKILINWNIFRIQINKEKITNKYLAYFLNHSREIIRKNATRSTMPFMPAGTLMKMAIAVPSVKEQKQIAEILSAVDEKISVNKRLKEKLTLLKKGLMQDLLNGKIRVNVK